MKKVVLVTGASSGMGRDFAATLAAQSYIVYGAARRTEKMQDLETKGVKVIKMDVTDDAQMVEGIDKIVKNEGRIDVLINNAGFGSYGAIEEVSMEDAKYQLDVNVFGAARLAQLVIPHMRKQKYGKIINISSIGGKFAMPMGGWYHASKFALEGLSDSLRNEVKRFGIDVVVIEPGGIKSEWADIAADNLVKVSGKGPYSTIANSLAKMTKELDSKVPGPETITRLVIKAIESKKPKTRYSGGYMAAPALTARRILSDNMLDKMMLSQLKIK